LNREPWVQRQAGKPLHHRGALHPQDKVYVILRSAHGSMWSPPLTFPNQTLVLTSHLMRATCSPISSYLNWSWERLAKSTKYAAPHYAVFFSLL
jgi:hypothetical protein